MQRVTKSQKVQISSHDVLQKLHNVGFAWHRSRGFLGEGIEKQKFSPFPINFLENNQKSFSSNLRVYTIVNEDHRRSWASHFDGWTFDFGHLCCYKIFQILVTSDLHQVADDANENHNYIA